MRTIYKIDALFDGLRLQLSKRIMDRIAHLRNLPLTPPPPQKTHKKKKKIII